MTRSSPCPMFTHISWLLKSRYRFPSGVQNQQPFAPATGIGSTFDCADHSNSVWALVRATSSASVTLDSAGATVLGFIEKAPASGFGLWIVQPVVREREGKSPCTTF